MKPAARKSKRQRRPAQTSAKTKNAKQARARGKVNVASKEERIQLVPIAKIEIGKRHRKKYGDLEQLAKSIKEHGLLQPIGITEKFKLVFGERRLRACRDILKETHILARVVNMKSIIAGEHDENELRKDFTPSERVAIAKDLQQEIGERRGNPSIRQNFDELEGRTDDLVAKHAGFGNHQTLRDAKKVVEKGTPKLIETMDSGRIAISTAARLVNMPLEKQTKLLDLDAREIRKAAAKCHSDGQPQTESARRSKTATERRERTTAIFADLKDHRNTMETILTPVCDEKQDVRPKFVDKRTLKYLLREIKSLLRDLEREWPADDDRVW